MPNETPGVYVEEVPVFPPSVAQVETAIPAFIGYTEIAGRQEDNDLHLTPVRIRSMLEYEQYFGGPQDAYGDTRETGFYVDVSKDSSGVVTQLEVKEPQLAYILYYAMRLFFDNGGSACYVISVGTYDRAHPMLKLSDDRDSMAGLMDGLDALKDEDEPALIVIPEAVQLREDAQYQALVQAVLRQCTDLQDRFAIFDLRGGNAAFEADNGNVGDSVAENNSLSRNRALFGLSGLEYGAAYYPFIKTGLNYYVNADESNVQVGVDLSAGVTLGSLESTDRDIYQLVKAELEKHYVVLPPSAAVAGVYTSTDHSRGVWKAPANVGLGNVIEPVIEVHDATQDAMNIDATSGKSINAIRHFTGKGTLVWGARTLAGNDNEWRYVPVRRLAMMIDESLKKSTAWVVFEPNDANTWVKVRGMIESYLTGLWRDGAFAGATPSEALFVRCGLGATMVQQDILDGRINVEVGVAAVRPAEFIIIKFSQAMNID